MMKCKRVLWVAMALLIMLTCAGAAVPKLDSSFSVKKIQVSCDDGMRVLTKEKKARFRRNVDLKLDSFRMRCQELEITYREKGEGEEKAGVETMVAKGNIRIEDPVREIKAFCDELSYAEKDGWLVMRSKGLSKLTQLDNVMEAKVIKMNVNSGEVLVEGQGSVEINIDGL